MEMNQTEIDAAVKYAKEREAIGLDYNQVYDAFLAGVDWQKKQPPVKPKKEYYGF